MILDCQRDRQLWVNACCPNQYAIKVNCFGNFQSKLFLTNQLITYDYKHKADIISF
jgi:hypothetical protein